MKGAIQIKLSTHEMIIKPQTILTVESCKRTRDDFFRTRDHTTAICSTVAEVGSNRYSRDQK